MAKKEESGIGFKVFIAGVAAAGTALGYYFYGPEGQKNRKKARVWMVRAKADVLRDLEKMKEVTEDKYNEIVDKVTEKYARMSEVGQEEAERFGKELKRHWKKIKFEAAEDDAKKKTARKSTKKKSS